MVFERLTMPPTPLPPPSFVLGEIAFVTGDAPALANRRARIDLIAVLGAEEGLDLGFVTPGADFGAGGLRLRLL
jgi:hypothetical protein